ncbi:MAG TPA: prepilin-type N-terminal cleavage/methylation domain-containing protein [Thermoanaerobaculia bacterium]|nr:prepilin-type N-terminal cleavage/methylation domain-containing protein [Thermoanaerobaculia bacterium]
MPDTAAAPRPPRRRPLRQDGFTIIELIIVVAMIGILAAMIMPALKNQPVRAKEAVLKTNLRTLRDVLDQHKGDKGHYPSSLEALVDDGYLREVPVDPMTGAADWELVYEEQSFEEPSAETDQAEDGAPGVYDVHSSSDRLSLDGTPYSEW